MISSVVLQLPTVVRIHTIHVDYGNVPQWLLAIAIFFLAYWIGKLGRTVVNLQREVEELGKGTGRLTHEYTKALRDFKYKDLEEE